MSKQETIRLDGQYQTRSGRPARVLCVNKSSTEGFSVVALVQYGLHDEEVHEYLSDGSWTTLGEHRLDLLPVSEPAP